MAKKIKLSIKNAQLAKALNVTKKLKNKTVSSAKKTGKKSEVESDDKKIKNPKARITIPKKKEAPKKVLTKKVLSETEINDEIKNPKIVDETPVLKEEKTPVEKVIVSEKRKVLSKARILKEEEKKPEPFISAKKGEDADPSAIKKKKKPIIKPPPVQDDSPFAKQKAAKKFEKSRFTSRDRHGLTPTEEGIWRRKRSKSQKRHVYNTIEIIRPKNLKIIVPITIKDLAQQMKLKASELISKLFMQGIAVTLNDVLEDETTIQLLGTEFNCEISIDRADEKRLQITEDTIKQEIKNESQENLLQRPPIVTFMGHVDHGKTSLIDAIRKTNVVSQEAGAITQHIGAFIATTSMGKVTILDTPGHEAFTEMRKRGSTVTDIVILVIAGDEGIKEQTEESITCAKASKVPIIVAINKCDKDNFDQEKVYRQLADNELLPEAWGGTTITINCSATTKHGINDLLEMISLQSEICELKSNPKARARGTILESEMHKGLGAVATVLVQNGTMKKNDAIVFGDNWGRIKTMQDQNGNNLELAGPSTPVKITGLSSVAEAGCEFIQVSNEKEAKQIAHDRQEGLKLKQQQRKKQSIEGIIQGKRDKAEMKILPLIIRADVQGSLEALKESLLKIKSKKVVVDIVSEEVGEISESDIYLSIASKAPIIGFHTRIESRAEELVRQMNAKVILHNIIYHAVDDVKELMLNLLDKLEKENDVGEARIKALFKSSQLGKIAGCEVTNGLVNRNHRMRIIRDGKMIWKGKINSIKKEKDDIKEATKGQEFGILLEGFSDFQIGDILETFTITYLKQTL